MGLDRYLSAEVAAKRDQTAAMMAGMKQDFIQYNNEAKYPDHIIPMI
jgi:hypothetical protein